MEVIFMKRFMVAITLFGMMSLMANNQTGQPKKSLWAQHYGKIIASVGLVAAAGVGVYLYLNPVVRAKALEAGKKAISTATDMKNTASTYDYSSAATSLWNGAKNRGQSIFAGIAAYYNNFVQRYAAPVDISTKEFSDAEFRLYDLRAKEDEIHGEIARERNDFNLDHSNKSSSVVVS
jgi:hypothetical protein